MVSINDFLEEIRNVNVRETVASGTISSWYYNDDEIAGIVNSFAPNRQLHLTRNDIINEQNLRVKMVKILVWGYPGDVRNTPTILRNLEQLIQLQGQYTAGSISGVEYLDSLLMMDRVGLSTASKILYFMNVLVNNHPAVIIDARVISAFSIVQDFAGLRGKKGKSLYLDAIATIHEIADDHTSPDQIEYFLFNLGKLWDNHIKEVVKKEEQCVSKILIESLFNRQQAHSLEYHNNQTEVVEQKSCVHSVLCALTYRSNTNGRQLVYPKSIKDALHLCWAQRGHVLLLLQDRDIITIKPREKDYQCFRQKEINSWAIREERNSGLQNGDIVQGTVLFYD